MISGAGGTDNPAEKVKVCNTCGDVGFDDCLAFCSHCNEGAEHVYCMVTVFDTVPHDWVCEGCKVKQRENRRKRRLVCDGIQPSHAPKKQALCNSLSAKNLGLLQSSFKKDSSENGTEQMQADKASFKASKEPACQGAMIKDTSLAEADQIPFTNLPTQKLGSNNANERSFVCITVPDVKKISHPVIPAKGVSANISSCSETDKSVSTSGCHNDDKNMAPKDLPSVSPKRLLVMVSTPPNSQSTSAVAQVVQEPTCLAEPLENVLVKDTSVIAVDMKISGERKVSEEQELNNTVLTSCAKGKPQAIKSVASMAERKSVNANEQIPINTDIVIRSTSNLQHSTINSMCVNSESMKDASSSATGMLVTTCKPSPIHLTSSAERGKLSVDEDIPKHMDIAIEKPTFKLHHSILDNTSLQSGSRKGASSPGTGKVVLTCRTAPVPTILLSERNSVCEDVSNHTVISLERPVPTLRHVTINSMPMKTESGCLVKRSMLHAATRDFPIITHKIKILGEKGEKIPIVKAKDKLPGKAVIVEEERSSHEELNSSGNKLQAKEQIKVVGGSNKFFNLLCEDDEHHPSGGILIEGMPTRQETDGSYNRLKIQQEEIAIIGSGDPSSLFFEGEKTKPHNMNHKGVACGSSSCLISGLTEHPSLFSKEEKTQPQDVNWKGSPSFLISGSAEFPSLFCKEEKAQPLNVKQKGGLGYSSSSLINVSGTSSSRTAPTHTAPAIERNVESLMLSPCTMKEPSCDVVLRQEESARVASGTKIDKISNLTRVAKRDFPPLKAQIEKVQKSAGHSHKETITPEIETPLEGKEQRVGSRLDADPKKVTRQNFPAIPMKVLPGKLKDSSSSTSVGNLTGVITPIEDDKRLPMEDVSAKHTVSNGIDIKAASERLVVEKEVFECKGLIAFPLDLHETRLEEKECLSNSKKECHTMVISSCVTKELHTKGVLSTIRKEAASVIKAAPIESASKRETTKKHFSSPCIEGPSSTRVATLECMKGPCLPGQMEGATVNDTSTIQLERKEVFGREPLSKSDGLNSPVEGECADVVGRFSILRQEGEALEAVAAPSCKVRSSDSVISAMGIAMRDASDAHSGKVTFTGKQLPLVEADNDFADKDLSDKVNVLPDRHTLRAPRAFNGSISMMDGGDQPSFFEPTPRNSLKWNKEALLSPVGSIRDPHKNAMYNVRESEDDAFHARNEDADYETSDRMVSWKSTSVSHRHYGPPDVEFVTEKHDHYSRASRHLAGDSGSFKEAYRCHRCDEEGHCMEFCKADRQREYKKKFSPDFDDRDFLYSRLKRGHAKRVNMGIQGSDGRKPRRYDPRREERFMDSRSWRESNAVDCIRMYSKRPKASEHTRLDEKHSYKPHMREKARFERFDEERISKSQMREEASFERFNEEHCYRPHMRDEASFEGESSRLQSRQFLSGMKPELKQLSKQPEYTRVHKVQIVRVQTQDGCKPYTAAQGPPEHSPFVAANFKNGKVYSAQGNVTSFPARPAGSLRGGYVNRLLSNQVPSTPQDQFCKDRIAQTHVASRLHGSSNKNFVQERRCAPDRQVMWTGCFNIASQASWATCCEGIQARPSNAANSKVFEALLALPYQLKLEEVKRGVETDSWPRSFQESPPTSHSIGVYFFAADMKSSGKWYKPLLHGLASRDLVLKVKLQFAQLLIFPSQLLPEAEQCWEDRYFLWGIFRNNKVIEDSSHLLTQPSDRDPDSESGSPTGNGEVIDMDVDTVGRKDANAVSQAWEEFNPALPPGFPPASPYHP